MKNARIQKKSPGGNGKVKADLTSRIKNNPVAYLRPLIGNAKEDKPAKQKPTVVLQTGWVCNPQLYSNIINELLENDFPVLVLTLRGTLSKGMGTTSPETFIQDNAMDAHNKIVELGLKDIVLFPHSEGGQAAIRLNQIIEQDNSENNKNNRINVRSIVLNAPSAPSLIDMAPGFSPLMKAIGYIGLKLVKATISGVKKEGDIKRYARVLLKLFIHSFKLLNPILIKKASKADKKTYRMFWKDAKKTFTGYALFALAGGVINRDRNIQALEAITNTNVTIISNEFDSLVSENAGDKLKGYLPENIRDHVKTIQLKGTSHFGHESRPKEVVEIIEKSIA